MECEKDLVPEPSPEPSAVEGLAARPFVVSVLIQERHLVGYRTGLLFAGSLDEAVGRFTRQQQAENPGSTISTGDGFEISGGAQQRIAALATAAKPA